jgi:hypothetical protein
VFQPRFEVAVPKYKSVALPRGVICYVLFLVLLLNVDLTFLM